jgi:hypothetical protein
MTLLLARHGWTMARVNWSRWVADCPSPHCASALQLYRDQPWFTCLDCGEVSEIEWPDMIEEIERILLMRPNPFTRNWEPGETLNDLYEQNLEHGVLPAPLDSILTHPGGMVFAVTENRIIVDRAALPSDGSRREIEG